MSRSKVLLGRSLRSRLLLMIGLSLTGLWLLLAPWLLYGVRGQVEKSLDDRLAASARMVASLVSRQQLPTTADGELPGDQARVASPHFPESLACRISTLRGDVVALSRDAPGQILESAPAGYSIREVEGQRWRVYTATIDNLRITTADRLSTRDSLMAAVVLAAGLPFLIALFGTLAAIGFGIQGAFRPLQRLTASVADRDLQDSSPLSLSGTPAEVMPLVDEINRLLSRVQRAMQRERRFTGDAAHELRTPLTAIKTQLQVARITKGEASERSLEQAELAVNRLQTTLEQLLLLARLEGDSAFENAQLSSGDEVSLTAVEDIRAKAAEKNLQLKFQLACAEIINAPAALVTTALRNLLDNAARFSPEGGELFLSSHTEGGSCLWIVRDQGPGVDPEHLRELTGRFVHLQPGGTGLGLAIVDTIARRFGGSLELANRKEGGFEARFRIPVQDGPVQDSRVQDSRVQDSRVQDSPVQDS
ncbi:two-component sensor histidine kinase [Proteobacteria bacterium 005FR1]|nr:two-component sensor histidine kinase [Proteobacteria bacterium 005FR1]